MSEEDPFRLQEHIPDEPDEEPIPEAEETSAPKPEIKGEEVAAPKVPLVEGFDPGKLTRVIKLEPDYSDRDAIRKKERSDAEGRSASLDISSARQGGMPTSRGRKGRRKGKGAD